MIAAAHQTMLAPQGAPLPYDAEVEYLDIINYTTSDNTYINQRVNTGIAFGPNTSVELDIKAFFESEVSSRVPAGATANISAAGFGLIGTFGGTRKDMSLIASPVAWGNLRLYGNITNNQYKSSERLFLKYDASTRVASWEQISGYGTHGAGGTSGSANFSFSETDAYPGQIFLFSMYGAIVNKGGSGCCRFYSFRIWDNGVLVRDYQPVRVGSGSSAVGYLFDRASGTLFGNAGTGAFTIGPDKT